MTDGAGVADGAPRWRRIADADLPAIDAISDLLHPGLPERPEVVAEKRRLFPDGALAFVMGGAVVGYGIAHPWTLRDVPKLDHVLGALPPTPDCVFIHDVAILPAARGHRASAAFVERMRDIARGLDIRALALVSVYDTRPVWSRYGFRAVDDAALAPALAPYGADARYMVADIR